MAIINKELIDAKKQKLEQTIKEAHTKLVKETNSLKDQLNSVKNKCTDMIDTFNYLKEQGVKNLESHYEKEETKLYWNSYDLGTAIDYTYFKKKQEQHCIFINGSFILDCSSSIFEKTNQEYLKDIDFADKTNYYLEQATICMTGFLKELDNLYNELIDCTK